MTPSRDDDVVADWAGSVDSAEWVADPDPNVVVLEITMDTAAFVAALFDVPVELLR